LSCEYVPLTQVEDDMMSPDFSFNNKSPILRWCYQILELHICFILLIISIIADGRKIKRKQREEHIFYFWKFMIPSTKETTGK